MLASCDSHRLEVKKPDGTTEKWAFEAGTPNVLFRRDFTKASLIDGWQAFGTYTFSRVSGLQPSSGSAPAGAQVSSVAGATQLTFGQDPNSLTNARGRLLNDRPHMFRVMGSIDVPRTGLVVSTNLQHFSGRRFFDLRCPR